MYHILVVDDDAVMCKVLEQVLMQQGYEISTARDGMAALAAIDTQAIDLIITDLQMPHLTGDAFVHVVCSMANRPPVIVICGDPHSDMAHEVMPLVDGMFAKPIELRAMLDTVAGFLTH